jgi:hypothetical protein
MFLIGMHMADIVFSLILGRTDLRGKFFLRKNLKPLKHYIRHHQQLGIATGEALG